MSKSKIYRFEYIDKFGNLQKSKTYVRAYQCQKSAENINFKKDFNIKFFEAEVDWQEVESVYNKNTISGGK